MVGLQRTFSDPNCDSPTASPLLDDHRPLAGGAQDYLSAFPSASQTQPYDPFAFFNGNNLGLAMACVDPQMIFAAPVAVEYATAPAVQYVLAPAMHHGGPAFAPVPTPMELLRGVEAVPSSYVSHNDFNPPVCVNSGEVDIFNQPVCINPAELNTTPQADNYALLDYPEPLFCEGAADKGFENDAGLESESELVSDDGLVSSPSSTLNDSVPPEDAAVKSKTQLKTKSKKRRSSGGEVKARKTKRRRASARDDEEYLEGGVSEAEVDPEIDDDGEFQPGAVSRSGRPVRGTRRVSNSKAVAAAAPVDTSDGEDEESVPELTCGLCSKQFSRLAEKQRHEQAASCMTDVKIACLVCHSAMTGRSDAMRRHQLRTKKCIAIQETMSPQQLADLRCVSAEEREIDRQRPAAKKQAAKKQASKKSRS